MQMYEDFPIWIKCPNCQAWLGLEEDSCPAEGDIQCCHCGDFFTERLAMNEMVRDITRFVDSHKELAEHRRKKAKEPS